MNPGALRRHALAAAFLAAATVVMTWPMAARWTDHTRDAGDDVLNAWIMGWNIDAVLHGWDLRDAPIFYPHKRALLLSESLLPQSALAAPVYLLTHNPAAAHNFVLLLALFLNGFAMYLLACELGAGALPAVLSGIVYAFSPYIMRQLNHLQTVSIWGLPLFFLFAHRFVETWNGRWLGAALLAWSLQVLMHGYHSVYLTYFGGLYVLYRLASGRGLSVPKPVLPTALGAAAALAVGAWYAQYRLTLSGLGLNRSMDLADVVGGSADLLNVLGVPPQNRLYGRLLAPFIRSESALFPGLTVAALAALGLRWSRDAKTRAFLWMAAAALALSWGPFIQLHGRTVMPGPYAILARWAPGWSFVRAPGRLGVVWFFCLAALAGVGLGALMERTRGPGRARAVAFGAIALVLVEYASFPFPTFAVDRPEQVPEAFRRLGARREAGPALILPMYRWYGGTHELRRMYSLLPGATELLNGCSGYDPHLYRAIVRDMHFFPSEHAVRTMQGLGVRSLLVERRLAALTRPGAGDPPGAFSKIFEDEAFALYDVPASPSNAAFLAGPEKAVPGREVEYALVMPGASCGAFGRLEVEGPTGGVRPLTGCVEGKRGLSSASFSVAWPGETGPRRLRARAVSADGRMLGEAEETVELAPGLYDTRDLDRPLAAIESIQAPSRAAAGSELELKAVVANVGDTVWVGDREDDAMRSERFYGGEGGLRSFDAFRPEPYALPHYGAVHLLVVHWRREGTPFVVRGPDGEGLTARGYAGAPVPAGEKGKFVMRLRAPDRPGTYQVKLGLAAEFGRNDSQTVNLAPGSPDRATIRIE